MDDKDDAAKRLAASGLYINQHGQLVDTLCRPLFAEPDEQENDEMARLRAIWEASCNPSPEVMKGIEAAGREWNAILKKDIS